MSKCYFLLLSVLFVSCGITKIHYVGQSHPGTEKVDVYVARESITKPFAYIGKGYVTFYGIHDPERMQRKSIEKAREKGADAILITDHYMLPSHEIATINNTFITDSTGRSSVTTGRSTVTSNSTVGFTILFLKYN